MSRRSTIPMFQSPVKVTCNNCSNFTIIKLDLCFDGTVRRSHIPNSPGISPISLLCGLCTVIPKDEEIRRAVGCSPIERALINRNRNNRLMRYHREIFNYLVDIFMTQRFAEEGLRWNEHRFELEAYIPQLDYLPLRLLEKIVHYEDIIAGIMAGGTYPDDWDKEHRRKVLLRNNIIMKPQN